MKLKLARIAAVIAVALPAAGVFAADMGTAQTDPTQVAAGTGTTGTDQTRASAEQHKWYQAGERALQAEKEREALDAAGFPQYGS